MMDYHSTHHAVSTRALQIGAVIAACFAGIGVAVGVHAAQIHQSWFLAVITGLAVGGLFGLIWHVLIGFGARVQHKASVVTTAAVGIALTILTLGASAQAIATAIAGSSAIEASLADAVDPYAAALADATEEAGGITSLVSTAASSAAAYRAMANMEAEGELGNGSGCGSRCTEMQSFAASYDTTAQALQSLSQEAANHRAEGEDVLERMREAASAGDQPAFIAATNDIRQVIARIEALDPAPIAATTGVVVVDTSAFVNLDGQTAAFQDAVAAYTENRERIEVPVFTPISPFEATRLHAFGSALHGWLSAIAVDLLPLIFLALVMVTMRDPIVRDPARQMGRPSTDEVNEEIRALEANRARGSQLTIVSDQRAVI